MRGSAALPRSSSIRFCAELRSARPDIVFGADLIAGFPTETDAMFENTLRLVEECGLTHLHVFPFSPREGTPAARMPQLSKAVGKERAARLRTAGDAAYRRHLKRSVGRAARVLVEREGLGRTEDFTVTELHAGLPGDIVDATITGETGERLLAVPTPAARFAA